MTAPPSVRAELAAAASAVNAAFNRLPARAQELVDISIDPLETEVDAAILVDDRDRALAAIRAWRQHWLATFEEAIR